MANISNLAIKNIMKICKKCKNEIPWRIKLENGKFLYTYARSYCIICSPVGTRIKLGRDGSPTTEIKNGKIYRKCSRCKSTHEENEKNFFSRTRGGFSSYCKSCDVNVMTERVKKLKYKAIEYKGGKCCKCGYNKCNRSLDFHHINPSEKDFEIASGSRNFEKIRAELDKCVLICKNCHGELHDGVISI